MSVEDQRRFEKLALPHLDAAFNLAVWLLHSRTDAEDVVQDAFLRAYQFFATFRGTDARGWLLRIVRNNCYTWLRKSCPIETGFDGELYSSTTPTPEALAIAGEDRIRLARELRSLPPRFREVIVLQELEGCSYREIAAIMSVPIGTVMSSLSRARHQLQSALVESKTGFACVSASCLTTSDGERDATPMKCRTSPAKSECGVAPGRASTIPDKPSNYVLAPDFRLPCSAPSNQAHNNQGEAEQESARNCKENIAATSISVKFQSELTGGAVCPSISSKRG